MACAMRSIPGSSARSEKGRGLRPGKTPPHAISVKAMEPEWSAMIRKLPSGGYRLYSRKINPKTGKRRNLGTFKTRAAAEKHERAVQYFKRAG